MVIPAKGKDYADVVRCVKEKVDPQKLGVSIKHIWWTNNADVLLKTKARIGEAEELKAALSCRRRFGNNFLINIAKIPCSYHTTAALGKPICTTS